MSALADEVDGASRRTRWSSSLRIQPIFSPSVGRGAGATGGVRVHPKATTAAHRAATKRGDGVSVRNVRDQGARDSGESSIRPRAP